MPAEEVPPRDPWALLLAQPELRLFFRAFPVASWPDVLEVSGEEVWLSHTPIPRATALV
jgi:hypothetical protein